MGRVYTTGIGPFEVLGYIPGTGVITGFFRFIMGLACCCIYKDWAGLQITRGILEMCGVGILFLPFDAGWCKLEPAFDQV